MSWWRQKLKKSRSDKTKLAKSEQIPSSHPKHVPSLPKDNNLEDRLHWFEEQFTNCSDIIYRRFNLKSGHACALIYLDGMTDQVMISDSILNTLITHAPEEPSKLFQYIFEDQAVNVSQSKMTIDSIQGISGVLDASVLLLVDGDHRMMLYPAASFDKRSIEEAPNETAIRGPREGFNENLSVNITLLRRRLKSPNFKSEILKFGRVTQTSIALVYIHEICKPELVEEVKRRLSYIDIDGVLTSSFVEETIEESPFSPFPQVQYTERPDAVISSLLEGRIGIIVDGTPSALIAPVTMVMLMQASEDYYQRFIASTWIRWIRYFFLFISLLLPSIYIAVTTFHPEMIPSKLLTTITVSREIVPFPAILEALIMEISFEALREASIRIPKSIGQAVSIIGALIIGTAAVQAGIVSAAMVIIVSLTGIASFIIPNFALGLSFRLLRFPIMICAAIFGLYGIACCLIIFYIHLINLKSFGVPYLSPLVPLNKGALLDTLFRPPWWAIQHRPPYITNNKRRQGNNSRGWASQNEEKK
ncbi:spore germination protein KA [Paenibacillus anaericanus]|uniref:spore germination protein n=1 Tax=Paenibacillus anaericanus TaxID=170367 RepID=UPI00278A36F5|nr:spore germination protein [Paenibacillus anaericanus]MDQ0087969.1 spore germination protein KA [Paenibacillus anaericanus]